ncbi:MAG: cobalt ECF transporter T component CbiQ [Hyphomicrobiaceae bacterium]
MSTADRKDGTARVKLLDEASARARLIGAAALIATIATLQSWAGLAAALVCAIAVTYASHCPFGQVVHRLLHIEGFLIVLLVLLPFTIRGTPAVVLGPLVASQQGLERALMIALKVNAAALLLLALISPLEPVRVGKALRRLGLPASLAHLLLLTLRYVAVLRSETHRLQDAMRARGFAAGSNMHTWKSLGNLTGQILVRSVERAERVEEAMRLRGFTGRFLEHEPEPMRGADLWFLGATTIAVITLMAVSWT